MAEKYIIQNPITIAHSGDTTKTVTLETAGTFVDRDVDVVAAVSVPAATVSVSGKTVSYTSGWVDQGGQSVQDGSLKNEATTGKTYTEDTSESTVLPSGGALYINEGYYSNTMIRLGHLIPDSGDEDAGVNEIRAGYEAFNTDGQKIVGTMPDQNPTFNGGAVTATAGASITKAPVVTISGSGAFYTAGSNYGVTGTKPSGTDGTNYLMVDAAGSTTNGTAKATANASSVDVKYAADVVGYVNKSAATVALGGKSATEATDTEDIVPTVTDNFSAKYIPIVEASFAGGAVTASASGTVATAPVVTVEEEGSFFDSTAYGVTSTTPSGTDGTNFLTVGGKGTATKGTVTAKADASSVAVTYTNAAGAMAAHTGAQALAGKTATQKTASIDVTPTVTDNFENHYIPIVSSSVTGGNVTATAGGSVTTAPSTNATISGSVVGKSTYGVTSSKPSGTDGTNYLTIAPANEGTNGTVTATADAERAAIHEAHGAGAIAARDADVIAKANATQNTKAITVTPTANTGASLYIPVASHTVTGGAVTATAGGSEKTKAQTTASVTASANFATYGGVTSAPTGTYVSFSPVNTKNNDGVATATAAAASTAVHEVRSAGVISALDADIVSAGSDNDSKDITVAVTAAKSSTNYYIPVVNHTASVSSHTVTAGSATASSSVGISDGYSSTGILNTAPTSGAYVSITVSNTGTAGSSSAIATSTVGASGVIASGNTTSGAADVKTVAVNAGKAANTDKYIKVYTGTYTIA